LCIPWSNCASGTYVANLPSSRSDRQCVACAAGSYTSAENQSVCLTADECPAGTVETAPATASSAAVCTACNKGQYCQGGSMPARACASGTWDHDANPATACTAWTDCAAGTFVSSPGTATSDRECTACTQAVVNEGTFSASINSAACTTWSTCALGSYVMTPPSPTSDRKCGDCPTGSYTTYPNQPSCIAIGPCAAGTVEQTPATASKPPVCNQCKVGQYCAGDTTPPVDCATGTWDNDRNPATACVPWTPCPAGGAVVKPGTATTDQVCSAAVAVSCKALLDSYPGTASGMYLIDPDDDGPIPAFSAYCDMTTNGGGWTNLDFANNQVLLANGIFVSCMGGLTYTASSIRCDLPYFDNDPARPLYHYRCDGTDNTANYILDFMALLLGHQGSTSLGFNTLQQSNNTSAYLSDDVHEYCYIGAYDDGAEFLWNDPACAAYLSIYGNGNCIPSYFVLGISD